MFRVNAWQVPLRPRRYRYRLGFQVNPGGSGRILFVGLNPSTATLTRRDPTVDIFCRGFAVRAGFEQMEIVNLFAFRFTRKLALLSVYDPVGPDNDRHIVRAARSASAVVVAWGRHFHPLIARRAARVLSLLARHAKRPLLAIARNADGTPTHPLYRSWSVPLIPFVPR